MKHGSETASRRLVRGRPVRGVAHRSGCRRRHCSVDLGGVAACGELACPACGAGSDSLSVPDGADGFALLRCACGHGWIAADERDSGASLA